ncbi:NAD(P)/FAD-dependent oxidoreductase [Sphingorhabdus sp. Alg239-R122]|uniref:NAD(P)/FAD-dependent oxidoreductase n=1 Tax=Sphingorhabdus sp. Alg239-R122 TaxID=2305989 RepID=UPI0013DC6637|nr:NAD(P)/FAD-dependent oxidoreductase [Sphingorhabdus sp. Alg239-R122]
MTTKLKTDYLIVGSGAVGMAFADTLLTETDANIIIVDRYAKPGGHWNVAYPFVTLHQPSQFYGVSSKELSKGRVDEVGLNKGLNDLATGQEVSAYFDDVMRHQFLPTGRVQYFPMCNYEGEGRFTSKLSGEAFEVDYDKLVDCTFLNTSVPSTHTPGFTIADGVPFIPLNDLPKVTEAPEGYVVVGGGKTGIDAVLWMLETGIDPDKITWIMPRDAWLINRANTQPSMAFFENTMGAQAAQFESIANAENMDDMFDRLEESGYFLRIDTDVRPKMFHAATVSEMEIEELRRVKNIVRMGRVSAIETDRIVLAEGEIPTSTNHLHVDCSASAITRADMIPVFNGNTITPQTVRAYQPVFSASLIAHVEASSRDEAEKNRLCTVVPLPNSTYDYMRMTAAMMMNQYNWGQDKEIQAWMLENRLDGFSKMVSKVDPNDTEKMDILNRLRGNAVPAMAKLQQFIAESAPAA